MGVAVAHPAAAQRTWRSVGQDLKNAAGDVLYVWSSPARADSRDWLTAALVLTGAAAISPLDDQIHSWMRRHPDAAVMKLMEPFREGYKYPLLDIGSGKRLQPGSGVLWLIGVAIDSRDIRDAGLGCAASQEAEAVTHVVAYNAIARRRPRDANFDQYIFDIPGKDWEDHSFYGGHAANIMSCVTFWSERFHLGLAEPALYVLAFAIGFGRAADQRHWTSDTVIGMAIGHAIGRTVARRQLKRLARAQQGAHLPAAASADGLQIAHDGGTVYVGWRKTF